MSLITRTATIQVRVVPIVKKASEEVLWSMGLNMSEAVELFLRRVIIDQRIPFEVAALEPAQIRPMSAETQTTEKRTESFRGMPRRGRGGAKKN